MIDEPIIDLINGLNRLPYCFTLQCCYGHFVYEDQDDPHNLEPLPVTDAIDKVEYRIAYIAFCIESSAAGRTFSDALKGITLIELLCGMVLGKTGQFLRITGRYGQVQGSRHSDSRFPGSLAVRKGVR